MFLIGQLILLKNPPSLTGESLLLPRRASYEAEWFDVALRFVYLSLGEISSANKTKGSQTPKSVVSYPKGSRSTNYIISHKFSLKNCSELVKTGPYRLLHAEGVMHLTCNTQRVWCILKILSIRCDEWEQTNCRGNLLGGNPENLLETAHMTLSSPNSPRDE